MSSLPRCSGTMRSTANCSRGFSSSATSLLVVPPVLCPLPAGRAVEPAITDRGLDAGNRAVDARHAGADPEEEQDDRPPRAGPEPTVERPAQPRRDDNRHDELDADAQADGSALLA